MGVVVLGATTLVLIALLVRERESDRSDTTRGAESLAVVAERADGTARDVPAGIVSPPELGPGGSVAPRPESLRGTEVDGGLVVDEAGNFVVTPDAIEMFDYFFVASGEEPDEDIVARIIAEIERRLGPGATAIALQLLDRYLEYRARVSELAAVGAARSLAEQFEDVVALRREIFGDDADLLFGSEEARVRVALAQREIALDPSIPDDERAELIDALNEELPESDRLARERATAPARLLEVEAQLRSEGASETEIRERRADLFGDDAADRLAELDRARAAWDARVASYRRERDAIAADPALTEVEREAAVSALLDGSFDGPERLRVEALDRIEAAGRS